MNDRIITFGEGLALAYAAEIGSLAHIGSLRISTGGAEANVAIGLARLGIPVTWLGRLGRDSFGHRVARELRAEGVDVRAIWDDDRAPTGLMIKERPRTGQSTIIYYRSDSAGSRLRPSDLDVLDFDNARLLHVTGITPALSASAADTVTRAVLLAREKGVAVSFDVNHRPTLWHGRNPHPIYRQLAESASIVFAGLEEARLIVSDEQSDAGDLAAKISAIGPAEVVIKLGAAGALAAVGGTLLRGPATSVQVVDTVGAGDALVAAYLAYRCEGAAPEARLAAGIRAGGFACTGPGDWESLPRRHELQGDPATGAEPVAR